MDSSVLILLTLALAIIALVSCRESRYAFGVSITAIMVLWIIWRLVL